MDVALQSSLLNFFIFAGMSPYWVFLLFLIFYLVIRRLEGGEGTRPRLASWSLLTGMLATLTSLTRVWKTPTDTLCVSCGAGAINRGWPFPWYGREGLDALGAPIDVAFSILFWWLSAIIVLWGAHWLHQRLLHYMMRRLFVVLAVICIIVLPLVFFLLPIRERGIATPYGL